jgi:hypothetical protein
MAPRRTTEVSTPLTSLQEAYKWIEVAGRTHHTGECLQCYARSIQKSGEAVALAVSYPPEDRIAVERRAAEYAVYAHAHLGKILKTLSTTYPTAPTDPTPPVKAVSENHVDEAFTAYYKELHGYVVEARNESRDPSFGSHGWIGRV